MCGIIGYVGTKDAYPVLIDGLKRLEYRGYDSSGVGIIPEGSQKSLVLRKTHGKIANLQDLVKSKPIPIGHTGVSHTRWATHGAPNQVNAHPHSNNDGTITLVHNGIIENYEVLKERLKKKGHKFKSDTDTEVIVHLISDYYKGDLKAAVQRAIKELHGAFALGVICTDHPDLLVAARIGSPLIIGLGKNENFIASDVPAILQHTKRVIYLKDGEMAALTKDGVEVFKFDGRKVRPKVDRVTFTVDAVAKAGYAHFMLKEIHEQPAALRQMLNFRTQNNKVHLEGLGLSEKQIQSLKQIVVIACGTAYHAGMVGKYIIESLARVPVTVDAASEFRYRDPIIGRNTVILAISQSGETADTLAAVREARARGAKIVSICNVIGSSLARESDGILYTHAGPEIGVASTKAYTAQLNMLYLLAVKLGQSRKVIKSKQAADLLRDLKKVPRLYEQVLKDKAAIARVARKNSHWGCFLFLGRNVNYPTALEGALKLKEISYIPAEGYAAGEMKHGPIALIDEYRAVICVATQSDTYDKMISNIQEINSRKGNIIAVATAGDRSIKKHVHHVIYVPKTNNLLTPLLAVLPLQLIAYYIAVKRGCDVDQPRNLAKSVTVE
ncbi:MAG: glutamine--fructose-6-phosphate transaminase (isomerizing) [Candidatus Omnitrophica bacterium]|nr:glutamine--fructose-6-phosphate transaminase (isomerizing) [Candidatus Omnitrophota bacterium]